MEFAVDVLQKCWFLAGPTASGKSDLGIALAQQLGAEVVALDSMSLYRRMDIGTAKPSAQQRNLVPHHLIDVIEPHQEYSLAEYVESAQTVCAEILDRQRIPLFVGGTGLFLRGVLRGVFNGPPADWDLRTKLQAQAAHEEPGYLHRRLELVDAAAAATLHPNDERRLIRALEVFETTGIPLSQQQRQSPLPESSRPAHVYWLEPPRDWLYDRINRRVLGMISNGLVEEVRQLLAEAEPMSRTAQQALGYKEVIEHLADRCTLQQCIEQIQTRTRQFAKRQHTWFRNLEECRPISITGNEAVPDLASQIMDGRVR